MWYNTMLQSRVGMSQSAGPDGILVLPFIAYDVLQVTFSGPVSLSVKLDDDWIYTRTLLGFPGGSADTQLACQCRRRKRCRFSPLAGKIPWRSSFMENSMDRGSWQATVHGVAKSQT